eukprot:14497137-Alexandrium_andersonii.AAC.1
MEGVSASSSAAWTTRCRCIVASTACAAMLKVSDRARRSTLVALRSRERCEASRAAIGAARSTSPAGSSGSAAIVMGAAF